MPDVHVRAQPLLGALARVSAATSSRAAARRRHVVALLVHLVRPVAEHRVERLRRHRHRVGVRDPGAVEAVVRLALLVGAHRLEGRLLASSSVRDGITAAIPPIACAPRAWQVFTTQLAVGLHERDGHRHLGAVRQHELRSRPEALDHREDVVPAAGVQPGGVVAQLVQDRVHAERGRDRLDQDGGLDRAAVEPERLLGDHERVAPERRLVVRLELRDVEVRAPAALEQRLGVPVHVQPEVHERARHRLPVDLEVRLRAGAARAGGRAGPRDRRRARSACPSRRARCVPLIASARLTWPSTMLRQVGRVRVLEVRHEAARARS